MPAPPEDTSPRQEAPGQARPGELPSGRGGAEGRWTSVRVAAGAFATNRLVLLVISFAVRAFHRPEAPSIQG